LRNLNAFLFWEDEGPDPERRKSCETIQNDLRITLFNGCLDGVPLLVQARA